MSISNQIKALLSMSGMKQIDLMGALGMASRQSLSNKVAGERWSAADLIKIAEATGSKLAFILPNGERVVLSADDPARSEASEGGFTGPVVGAVTRPNNRPSERGTGGILSSSVEGAGYPSE